MKRFGFTLIEVLIATAIFAVISTITFQGLQSSMEVQHRVESHAQDLSEMQLVWTVLFQDFVNMTRRPIREEGRDKLYPAFDLSPEDDSDCIVSFTRAGLPLSNALPAGMQRLAYCIRESSLYRVVWPVLDRPADVEAQESLLMENIEDFIVETYPDHFDPDEEKEGFAEDSPDDKNASKANPDPVIKNYELPVGVVVTIETSDETFVRWFPGGAEYKLDIDDN